MSDEEFKCLDERAKKGEKLAVVDQFLYDQEKQRRELGPNVLQQQDAARISNPLLR